MSLHGCYAKGLDMNGEELRSQLEPLRGRNPLADVALLRLMLADDPDAEAERIIDDFRRFLQPIIEPLCRLAKAAAPIVTAWIEGGIEDAEDFANTERDTP